MSEEIPNNVEIAVALARMEGKLDLVAAQHSGRIDEHQRRITTVEMTQQEFSKRIGIVETYQAASRAADARDDRHDGQLLTRRQLLIGSIALVLTVLVGVISSIVVLVAHKP